MRSPYLFQPPSSCELTWRAVKWIVRRGRDVGQEKLSFVRGVLFDLFAHGMRFLLLQSPRHRFVYASAGHGVGIVNPSMPRLRSKSRKSV